MIRSAILILAGLFITAAPGNAQPDERGISRQAAEPDTAQGCSRSLLFNSDLVRNGEIKGEVPVWQMPGGSAFFFETGMTIDADGAPNAYNPDNTGIDDLENAGEPGHWWALAVDKTTGQPYLQGSEDPYPGYYVSTTALWDRERQPGDPGRYVDATAVPYIVLPHEVAWETGTRLGDFAMVFNLRNGNSTAAIFADIGPSVGEGSIALAEQLGIRSDARRGGARGDIFYLVFPGSGDGKPKPAEEIKSQADALLQKLGGPERVAACAMD